MLYLRGTSAKQNTARDQLRSPSPCSSKLPATLHHKDVPGTRILGSWLSGSNLGLLFAIANGAAIEQVVSASTTAVRYLLNSMSVDCNVSRCLSTGPLNVLLDEWIFS